MKINWQQLNVNKFGSMLLRWILEEFIHLPIISLGRVFNLGGPGNTHDQQLWISREFEKSTINLKIIIKHTIREGLKKKLKMDGSI